MVINYYKFIDVITFVADNKNSLRLRISHRMLLKVNITDTSEILHTYIAFTPDCRLTCCCSYDSEKLHRYCPSRISLSMLTVGWGGSVAEWLPCWTQAQKGLGSNRSRDAVG